MGKYKLPFHDSVQLEDEGLKYSLMTSLLRMVQSCSEQCNGSPTQIPTRLQHIRQRN